MVILWTDALIFLLLVISFALGFYLHDKEHIRRPLKKLANNKTGMVSLTILVFFLVIGLLDSIHYKSGQSTSNEVISFTE